MAAFEVYRFHDSANNTIRYMFDSKKRQHTEEPFGPVMLDQVIETFDPELDTAPSEPIPEPKPGTELFRYTARDGASVRYQYDRTACLGKEYVVAIHRDAENWQRLREEELAVDDELNLRKRFEQMPNGLTTNGSSSPHSSP